MSELDQSKAIVVDVDPLRVTAVHLAIKAANTANAASLGQNGLEIFVPDMAEEIYEFLTGKRAKAEVTEKEGGVIYANFGKDGPEE